MDSYMKFDKCPGCGAPQKYPNKPPVTYEHGYPRNRPIVFTCGTVASPDWSPPVYDKNCRGSVKDSLTV